MYLLAGQRQVPAQGLVLLPEAMALISQLVLFVVDSGRIYGIMATRIATGRPALQICEIALPEDVGVGDHRILVAAVPGLQIRGWLMSQLWLRAQDIFQRLGRVQLWGVGDRAHSYQVLGRRAAPLQGSQMMFFNWPS